MERKTTAIFDFDGTLYRYDSLLEFAIFVRGEKRLALAGLKALPWIMGWRFGLCSNFHAKRRLFKAVFAGMPIEEFEARGRQFAAVISQRLHPCGEAWLEEMRKRGAEIIILTASMPQWIRPWAHAEGIHTVIGTEPEVEDGKLTGNFATPNCHGKEKPYRLMAERPDVPNTETYAFGDSKSDRYMFEFADHGVKIRKK